MTRGSGRTAGSWRDDRGVEHLEYVVLLGVVALLGVPALQIFSNELTELVREQAANLALLGL